MKKLLLFVIVLLSVTTGFSQQADLDNFNIERNKTTKTGMIVLSSWGAANLISGAIGMATANGTDKYFHEMNLMWGGINLGLGVLGYLGAKNKNGLGFSESLRKQMGVEKTYLFNAGLDLTYITAGFYLKERAKHTTKNPQRMKGYGNSLLLQGAGLLLTDCILYAIHNKHGKKLYKMADKMQVALTGNGIGVVVKL